MRISVLFRLVGPEFLAVTRKSGDSLDPHWAFLAGSSRQGGLGSRAVAFSDGAGGCGKLLDLLQCSDARRGLGVARARVEDHPPKAPGLGLVAPLLGPNGEVPQGEVTVDA